MDWFNDVLDFHKKFNCEMNPLPTFPLPSSSVRTLRNTLITDELMELQDCLDNDDVEGIADSIVNTIYVLVGMAVSFGIDIRPIWDEVHKTNMLKKGGLRYDGKILKDKNWQPPKIKELLDKQEPII